MATAGSVPTAIGNGTPFNGRQQPTPADMVGNQFVSQFYTVLHSSPRYLHRFYTDDSTVTHADCGLDGEPPRSTTVSTQKGISERVMAMGFEEAVTEIWSVDSQYSQNNGVMVMVTGSLQCKGKKKRDFVQSFFLAVQEKGYFVLNDTFRYLSDRASSRPTQYPKENGYVQPDYSKGYGQMGGYHPTQQPYYPNHIPVQNSGMYAMHTTPSTYPQQESAPPTTTIAQQNRTEVRAQPITPSMPQRMNVPVPTPTVQKVPVTSPAGSSQSSAQTQQPTSAPIPPAQQHLRQHLQQGAVVHTSLPPQPQAPTAAAPSPPPPAIAAPPPAAVPPPQAATPSVPAQEAPKQAPQAAINPTAPKTEAPPPQEKPTAPVQQVKQHAKQEPASSKQEQAPSKAAEPTSEVSEPSVPAAPLSYADKLKLGAREGARPVPSKPSSAPPKQVHQQQNRPAPAANPAPIVADSNGPPDVPSTTQPTLESSAPPEETVTTSIFVRDLPEGITVEKLEAAFSRFGAIKGGPAGINLKLQRGKDNFAFLEFEEAAAMSAAVEGQVIIDGKTATVMERRPSFPRNLKGPGYQRRDNGGRGDGRGFRGGPGRDRGRSRGDGRPFTGGRNDGRGDGFAGREGGRGRFGGGYVGDNRGDGGRGRGEGNRGRGRMDGGRGPRTLQSAPPNRPQQAT